MSEAADHGAGAAAAPPPFILPPRHETFLVRYSRRSKFATLGLCLVSLIALSYLANRLLARGEAEPAAGHHAAAVHGADAEGHGDKKKPVPNATEAAGGGSAAESLNAQDDRSVPMAPAPDPGLTDTTPQGDLPRTGEDGRKPWQVYARPFDTSDTRPRLAILVAGLGLSRTVTGAAVTRLPAGVTLAFDVQGPVTAAWCGAARREGHEILLSLPMEPLDFPRSDPGPHTLLTTSDDVINQEKLNWALRQGAGYVGVTSLSGSQFTGSDVKLRPMLDVLQRRGLLAVDARVAPRSLLTDIAHDIHLPTAAADIRIDDTLSPGDIDAALAQLEQAAKQNGHALGIVPALPVVIDRLQAWLKTLPQDGIALAPVSAVVQ